MPKRRQSVGSIFKNKKCSHLVTIAAAVSSAALAGCVSTPDLVDESFGTDKHGDEVLPPTAILDKIRCELIGAIKLHPELVTDGQTPKKVANPDNPNGSLVDNTAKDENGVSRDLSHQPVGYTGAISLTLQVDVNAGLAPTLTAIMPYAAPTFSLQTAATGQLNTTARRVYGQNFTFSMRSIAENFDADTKRLLNTQVAPKKYVGVDRYGRPNYDIPDSLKALNAQVIKGAKARYDANGVDCNRKIERDYGLTGNLGIEDVVAYGLGSFANTNPDFKPVSASTPTYGAFGEQLQFVINKNVTSAGPTWTVSHFKGPGGLVSAGRMDTHSLTISLAAPQGGNGGGAGAGGKAFAAYSFFPSGGVGAYFDAGAANAAIQHNQSLQLLNLGK